ncbi:MAG TPA: hypothetical protein VK802_25855 [Streptosporangiaceae bacterium]|nr:hypothetical protein [Streptosporangiaceae bacterium]
MSCTVVVWPDRRGTGIDHALLGCLMASLRPIPVVTLFCSPDLVPFYELTHFAAPGRW